MSHCHWSPIPTKITPATVWSTFTGWKNPEHQLLLSSNLCPMMSSFSSSLYWERLFFLLSSYLSLLQESNSPSPSAAPPLWGTTSCMGFTLPQPTSQFPPNIMLSGVDSTESKRTFTKVTSELWADWFLLKKLLVSRQVIVQSILWEQFKGYSGAHLISPGSSFTYVDANIFLFFFSSGVYWIILSDAKMKTHCRVQLAL